MKRIKETIEKITNMPLMYLSIICFGGLFIIGDFVKNFSTRFLIIMLMIIIGTLSFIIQIKIIVRAQKRSDNHQKRFWTIRLDNNEYNIEHPADFHGNFDNALTDLEMGEIPFIVLSPPKPINDITYLQVAMNENSLMHIEAGIITSTTRNDFKLLYKDDLTTGEVLDIFILFFSKGELNVSEWKELEYAFLI